MAPMLPGREGARSTAPAPTGAHGRTRDVDSATDGR